LLLGKVWCQILNQQVEGSPAWCRDLPTLGRSKNRSTPVSPLVSNYTEIPRNLVITLAPLRKPQVVAVPSPVPCQDSRRVSGAWNFSADLAGGSDLQAQELWSIKGDTQVAQVSPCATRTYSTEAYQTIRN
jgi:hypothetical protein